MADKHAKYIQLALEEARKSPPKPTNYCVGAVLLDADKDEVLATGYTLELEGNTHAEQCCLTKFGLDHDVEEEDVGFYLPQGAVLYTTMEPCVERNSGNLPCVERILQTWTGGRGIRIVYTGVQEPETFVKENAGRARLEAAGIECVHVPGFEEEILTVATAGHVESEK